MKTSTTLKYAIAWGIGSTILFTPVATQALTVEEVTNPQSTKGEWVTDMANILSDATEAELNQTISNLEQTNGAEIAVVTVPETAPADSPKTFATELFNYWGIGKAESDNGILFLVSTSDRRVEIETGYGMEGILPDAQVGNIIDTQITPQYKQGNYDRGTLDGTNALIGAINSPAAESLPTSNRNKNWNILSRLAYIAKTTTSPEDTLWLFWLFMVGGIYWLQKNSNKVFVDPHKTIISLERTDSRDIYCTKCKQSMEWVYNIKLTKVQQVAKKIGSVSYKGYKCSSCSNALQPYSLIAYVSCSSRYQKCPECKDLTVSRTEETLEAATYSSKGKLLAKDKCHCCNYFEEKIEDIPRLRRKHKNRGSRSSNGIYYGGSSSSGSSGGGGGGGFGGGSSGGGGAGGDF